jgi:hypothetical protein
MNTDAVEIARDGRLALTVERHWYAGHGIVANCWRYTVTVDGKYGASQVASAHYSRATDTEARAVAVARGTDAMADAIARFSL